MEKFRFLTLASALIAELRKEAPEMPAQMLHVFLEVARDEGISPSDIQHRLGQTRSSASRNLLTLADGVSSDRPGYKWLEWRLDPMDSRAKLYYVSAKGKEVINSLAASLP